MGWIDFAWPMSGAASLTLGLVFLLAWIRQPSQFGYLMFFLTALSVAAFKRFLESLLEHRSPGQRLVLVLDNAKYHHARALQPWLRQQRQRFALLFLPPYSPELNPIERVWKLTRRLATHNRHFPTLNDIMNAVCERFTLWARPNRQLARLCAII